MLLDPVTRTESGSAGPAQQAATLLSYAKTSRSGLAKPSVDVFGQVRSQSGVRIEEVSLERIRVSRKYRSHLDNALGFLLLWVTGTCWAAVEWAKEAASANQVLCELIQWLHTSGHRISLARHSVLAVQSAHRELRGRLGRAWDCIKSWLLEVPLRSRIPMPHDLVRAFFAYAVARALECGKDLETLTWFSFAVLVRLGFDCLLRPAEILKLTVADVRLPRSQYEPRVVVIRLRDTKNRASLGRFQFCMVEDPGLVSWIEWIVAGCDPQTRLWPGTATKFRKTFDLVLRCLGLARLRLTPGCLRPGGATRLFLSGLSVNQLKYKGRWRVESSLEVYVQEAMCHLAATELSDDEHMSVVALLEASLRQWSAPPSVPWSVYFSRSAQWRARQLLPRQPSACCNTKTLLPLPRT